MLSNSSLLARLTRYGQYEEQFTRAKNLVEDILKLQVPKGLQVLSTDQSYYDDHGADHIQRVISRLEALDKFLTYSINEREAFVLLVATYFHDIGMFVGRLKDEDPELTRREHHKRSAEVIQRLNDEHYLDIGLSELSIIKKVIEAHRVTDLQDLLESQRVEGTEIRTRLLGALLRLADACDCDRSRAPRAIFDLFYHHIPEGSRQYWEIHFPVTDVSFNATRASIVVSMDLNKDLKAKIEKHRMGNWLEKKLTDELESVGVVFRYNHIPIVRVEIQDFNLGKYVDFSSLPVHGDVITVTLRSGFEKVDQLVGVVTHFVSDTFDDIPLVIEIRPPEGPLYVDTKVRIDGKRLREMSSALQETLGPDLWHVSGEVVEKITIRRGMAV